MGEALMDDDMQGWAHQCELEYRRFEEETNAASNHRQLKRD
jgi:hypothetical protein